VHCVVSGFCEHGDQHLGKHMRFLDPVCNDQLSKADSVMKLVKSVSRFVISTYAFS
jgi:hypothetical protein